MASKRGNGRQAVRNGNGASGWILFGSGVVVGAVLCAIVVLGGYAPSLRRHDQPQPNPQATAPQASAPGIADQAAKDASKPTFDFYSVLPEKEVVIPDAQLSAQAKAEQQKSATVNNANSTGGSSPSGATSNGYLLQVGSFPSSADADSMKAKLALQGFTANVQPVNINGQTWHRVRLGPFASATDLESAKQRLSSAGIHAIALKEK